jgi:flagellar L-ring protein precursor FlgH
MGRLSFASIAVAACLLTGCLSIEPSRIAHQPLDISRTYRTAPVTPPVQEARNGSVWRGRMTTLFSDQKARNVGDTITVRIEETSKASESASTATTRKSQTVASIGIGVPHAAAPNTLLNANTPNNDFTGTGEPTRSGTLIATMTARVMDVLPNGNLVIEGKREILINNEKKELLVQGIVRPKDIEFDNSVASTLIADAKVIYSGIGVGAEKQRPGWGARLFDFVWPF